MVQLLLRSKLSMRIAAKTGHAMKAFSNNELGQRVPPTYPLSIDKSHVIFRILCVD